MKNVVTGTGYSLISLIITVDMLHKEHWKQNDRNACALKQETIVYSLNNVNKIRPQNTSYKVCLIVQNGINDLVFDIRCDSGAYCPWDGDPWTPRNMFWFE